MNPGLSQGGGDWGLRSVPIFDHGLGLLQCVEDLAVEQFIAQLAVDALAVAILPWTSRLDVSGLNSDGGDPIRAPQR